MTNECSNTEDVPAYFAQVREIHRWDFDTLVGGHVARTGTRADVATQLASDLANPWAIFDHYIDRVVVNCVNQLTPKWSTKLAAFDVYIWDQCYSMEQSLRID